MRQSMRMIWIAERQLAGAKTIMMRKLQLLCLYMRQSMRMIWKNWNPSSLIAVKILIQVSAMVKWSNGITMPPAASAQCSSTQGVEKFRSQINNDDYDDEEILLGDDPTVGDKRDCLMSLWSDWSACSSSCGRGWMTMMRSVVSPAMNGGRPCPKKMFRRRRCEDSLCGNEY